MDLFAVLRKKRILLIDDDEWIRNSLTLFFEAEGCRLEALETAEEALEVMERRAYDIIIVDYKLPGMDGLAFLKVIAPEHERTLKILITAYASKELFSESRKLGIHEFIEKPFTSEVLENALSRALGVAGDEG